MMNSMKVTAFIKAFGNTDIYLLDAILKGVFDGKKTLLDAGCGEGRNLPFFLSNNFEVFGIDENPTCIRYCNMMAKSFQEDASMYQFVEGNLKELPYPNGKFEIIICSAVLHFAKDELEFIKMFSELGRVLKNRGILFIRMASSLVANIENSENNFTYLLSEKMIPILLKEFKMNKLEPVKSVMVERKRVMTTLLLQKI